ncbi:MAG TPA: hypothetical protein P5556_10150 [Candidatus Gastranaerophilales bacterium]|nr:hypothetical protein [Candidatus Gastranaerophilales bacterium]
MGLADMQLRKHFLAAKINDDQYYLGLISQKRMKLAEQSMMLTMFNSSMDEQMYEQMTEMLHYQDKQLEQQKVQLETQLKIAESEQDSVNKCVDNQIKTGFKYA